VIMLRRKFGRRTGGRPFSVVARGSTASGDRSPIYRARSVIYLCLFARALIGRSLCSSALRAYDARLLCSSALRAYDARLLCSSALRAYDARLLCSSALRAYDARSLMDFSTGSPFPVSVVVVRHAWQRSSGGLLR